MAAGISWPLLLLSLVAVSVASSGELACLEDDSLGFTALVQTDQHRRHRALQAVATNRSRALPTAGSPPVPDVRASFAAMGQNGQVIKVNKGRQVHFSVIPQPLTRPKPETRPSNPKPCSAWPVDHYKNYMPPYAEHIESIQRFKGNYLVFSGA